MQTRRTIFSPFYERGFQFVAAVLQLRQIADLFAFARNQQRVFARRARDRGLLAFDLKRKLADLPFQFGHGATHRVLAFLRRGIFGAHVGDAVGDFVAFALSLRHNLLRVGDSGIEYARFVVQAPSFTFIIVLRQLARLGFLFQLRDLTLRRFNVRFHAPRFTFAVLDFAFLSRDLRTRFVGYFLFGAQRVLRFLDLRAQRLEAFRLNFEYSI